MMLLDYFRVFGWISRNRDEISKSRQFRGPMSRRRGLTQQRNSTPRHGMSTLHRDREGGLDKPRVSRDVAKLCRGEGLRRSVALFIDMCFCHVLLFHYSEDLSIENPISV